MIAEPGEEHAMTIERIQADHYRIPLPRPLSDSTHHEIPGFELITVRVTTADGVVGLGYTYTVGRGGRAIVALIEELAEVLDGADEGRIEDCWQRMWWALHWVGRGGAVAFAMAAIDVALWDIQGKRAGLPLWRLLGGSNPHVPVYAGGIDLYFTLDELLEQTRGNLNRGFRAIKMKARRGPSPAGHFPRRSRPARPPAGGRSERVLPRMARLRPGCVHRESVVDRRRQGDRTGAPRTRRGARLERAGTTEGVTRL
jgi:L-alanine-DL-glutamate epimerase-like enolase superfamily enzyme